MVCSTCNLKTGRYPECPHCGAVIEGWEITPEELIPVFLEATRGTGMSGLSTIYKAAETIAKRVNRLIRDGSVHT